MEFYGIRLQKKVPTSFLLVVFFIILSKITKRLFTMIGTNLQLLNGRLWNNHRYSSIIFNMMNHILEKLFATVWKIIWLLISRYWNLLRLDKNRVHQLCISMTGARRTQIKKTHNFFISKKIIIFLLSSINLIILTDFYIFKPKKNSLFLHSEKKSSYSDTMGVINGQFTNFSSIV
jgi:hypothetical protein